MSLVINEIEARWLPKVKSMPVCLKKTTNLRNSQQKVTKQSLVMIILFCILDWEADAEDTVDKQLWEDNWDDDNVEDDFSIQLR